MSYDPWAEIKTRNGFSGDEIISMLQKSIRRGLEKLHWLLPMKCISRAHNLKTNCGVVVGNQRRGY